MKLLALVLAFGVAACGSDKAKPPGSANGSSSAGSGSAPLPKVGAGRVIVFVDDTEVAALAPAQIQLWPRVDTLVPVPARRLGTWQSIKLVDTDSKTVEIKSPSGTYPELVPALFPGDDGAPAFGMFDPVELAKHGAPAVRENNLREIRVSLAKGSGRGENEHGDGGGTDPALLKLTIKTATGEKIITGSELLAIPREAPPGTETEGKGWKLSTVLAKAGVTKYQRLLLADVKGTNLTLEKQDLDDKAAVPFIKLNRQGTLRFRVFRKQGDTWQPSSDLRGLAHVEVLK
jgi:hypothetical protein